MYKDEKVKWNFYNKLFLKNNFFNQKRSLILKIKNCIFF